MIDPNDNLTRPQREAYEEVTGGYGRRGWRAPRFDAAVALVQVLVQVPAGQVMYRDRIADRAGIPRQRFHSVMRDARIVACMVTGLTPQTAIHHDGGGWYGFPDQNAIERWLTTRARSIHSQARTVERSIAAYDATHPGVPTMIRARQASESLTDSAAALRRALGDQP